MALSLLVLALSCVPQTSAPGGFEIIRTWTGKELDHIGIGLSALGDVDGDGTPDFILGAMHGAYTFYFGPGYADVVSGKDGHVLYTVRGRDEMRGYQSDAFGDTIATVGDLDCDGVPDFAVGAWLYQEFNGYVRVFSGRTGTELATIDGGSNSGSSIVPLGDLDGDAVPDFAIGGDHTTLISGGSFRRIGECAGQVLARAGDQLLQDRGGGLAWISRWDFSRQVQLTSPGGSPRFLCGDIDGDGWLDLVRVCDSGDPYIVGSTAPRALLAQFLSGMDGRVVRECALELPDTPPFSPANMCGGPLGDVDGDGVPDAFVCADVRPEGSVLWVIDGASGKTLARERLKANCRVTKLLSLGDIDHDGQSEFLLGDYESQAGARCGGAVHLVRIRIAGK